MKRIILILFISLFQNGFAQPGSFYLNQTGDGFLFGDQNLYISSGSNLNKIIKADYSGNVIWTKEGRVYPQALDDQYIYCSTYDSAYNSIGICKLDTAGSIIWAKDLTASIYPLSPGNKNGVGSIVLNSNRIYITSSQYDSITWQCEYGGIITIDTSGNYVNSWCNTISLNDCISRCFPAYTGAWVISRSGGIGYEEGISKLNYNGSLDSTSYGSFLDIGGSIRTNDIINMPDSCFFVYSYVYPTGGFSPSDNKIFMMKMHENGTVAWAKTIQSQPLSDTAYMPMAATCDSVGNIYLIGYMSANWGTDAWTITMKLDSSGNYLFVKKWNTILPISIKKIFFKSNQLYCAVVYATSYPGILIFDSAFNACTTTDIATSIPIQNESIPQSLSGTLSSMPYSTLNDTVQLNQVALPVSNDLCLELSTNYLNVDETVDVNPNPVSTSIKVTYNSAGESRITLYNLMGEMILEKTFSKNTEINLSDLPSGLYQLVIVSRSKRFTKKIIKI